VDGRTCKEQPGKLIHILALRYLFGAVIAQKGGKLTDKAMQVKRSHSPRKSRERGPIGTFGGLALFVAKV
jgi:hypothetical protein